MDYKQIQDLIKLVKKNQIAELKIEQDDFRIVIKSQGSETKAESSSAGAQIISVPAPAIQPAATAHVGATQTPPPSQSGEGMVPKMEEPAIAENQEEIKSPMIGTFYRAAGPDKDPFVSVGSEVTAGDTICIIEAMKLFNEIEAEVSGKIVSILVEDASPVEYDQPLFLIEPK